MQKRKRIIVKVKTIQEGMESRGCPYSNEETVRDHVLTRSVV